jgi:arginine-tRNA-protein transferase
MWAYMMSCQDYQDLIDRGWRRSGKYVYKPAVTKSCCPPYTIKCDAINFQLSKSQKKVLKKMTKFIVSGSISTAGCHGEVLETKQSQQQRSTNDGVVTASGVSRIQAGEVTPVCPSCIGS